MRIVELIAKAVTMIIFPKALRKKWRNCIKTYIYGYQIFTTAKTIGKDLYIGNFSKVNKNTELGNNVNFNGMQIHGEGNVKIGDNFHSGVECLIITHNHNYEGDRIPYDDTYVYKDVEIGDCV